MLHINRKELKEFEKKQLEKDNESLKVKINAELEILTTTGHLQSEKEIESELNE